MTEPASAGKQPAQAHWLFGVAGCWMLLFLPAFLVLHLASLRPIRSTYRTVTFTGVSPGFADEVEDEREEDWD